MGHHWKRPFDKRFVARQNPWPSYCKNSDGRAAPSPEDKQVAGKWIGVQFLPAQLGNCVDPLPSIYRLNRNQNPYLRRDLNHPSPSRQARSKLTQSRGADAFHWMRILLPLGASNSITHSSSGVVCGAISSTNAGLFALRRLGTPPSRFFSPI
jgi:hypothetical protein